MEDTPINDEICMQTDMFELKIHFLGFLAHIPECSWMN